MVSTLSASGLLRAEQNSGAARLRAGELGDLPKLVTLYGRARPQAPESEESMTTGLEQGGVLVLEDTSGSLLAALRWREAAQGWWLEPTVTLPGCDPEFARWLLTKLEALAIQRNIPLLYIQLDENDRELLRDYRRLGYSPDKDYPQTLSKRVGGVWQYKAAESRNDV